MLPNYQACSPFVLKHITSLLASERSERDTYRGNTIENRGCLFVGERDTYRGNTIENRGCLLASERSERDSY